MALPERNEVPLSRQPLQPSATARDGGYVPGGQVGQLQVDLAARLAQQGSVTTPEDVAPGERLVRFISVAGGYAALLAGYAVVALLIFR